MKPVKSILAVALVLMMLFVSCNPENPVKTFKVNYMDAEGNVFDTHVVEEGKMDIPPSDPTKEEGYVFMGWYLSEDGKDLFDFSTPITGDITLYPIWVKGVAVSFYDGTHLVKTMYCVEGREYDFPSLEEYLGDGFEVEWRKEDKPVEGTTFTVSSSVEEYKYYAYITTDLMKLNEEGAICGTEALFT